LNVNVEEEEEQEHALMRICILFQLHRAIDPSHVRSNYIPLYRWNPAFSKKDVIRRLTIRMIDQGNERNQRRRYKGRVNPLVCTIVFLQRRDFTKGHVFKYTDAKKGHFVNVRMCVS
jgi:hypothetical protein